MGSQRSAFSAHLLRRGADGAAEWRGLRSAAALRGGPTAASGNAEAEAGPSVDRAAPRGAARRVDDDAENLARAPDREASFTSPDTLEALDPMTRALRGQLLASAPAAGVAARADDPVAQGGRVSLDHLLSRLVRRIAWSGDGHAGTAHIEFGAGELEGATLTLRACGADVQVSLDLPAGVDAAVWKQRIGRRLSARGLQVSSLEVT